jgi:hypothetical protein
LRTGGSLEEALNIDHSIEIETEAGSFILVVKANLEIESKGRSIMPLISILSLIRWER